MTGSGQGSAHARARIYFGTGIAANGEPSGFQDINVPGKTPYDGVYVG